MDLLKSALLDAKKQSLKARKPDNAEEAPKKKYLRRGEVAAATFKREQEDNPVFEPEIKEADKRPDRTCDTKNEDGLNTVAVIDDDDIDDDEVKRRLRDAGEVLTFFGETNRERLQRLKLYELHQSEKHGGSMGTGHEIQAIIEQEVDKEIVQATLAAMDNNEDTEESRKEAAKRERMKEKRHNKYQEMKARDQFSNAEDFIIFFFKRMLLVWEEELASRPADEKSTMKGKVASATQKQTRQYMNPLFKQLKKGECPKDVVKNTENICARCIEREYVKANESYLKMAIGNAAWPMGVTMVGIHERAGREKIFSQNVAHVLNNEMSRKYIQGMKRIMTFCQHAYPNVPSKMVV